MMESQNLVAESQNLDRSQPIRDGLNTVGAPVDVIEAGIDVRVNAVELGSGGREMVKKKRGRPPKAQAKPPPAKKNKEVVVVVPEEEEDVCFICFDGGSLVLCDRRGCPKAYHPACIKRDEAFFESAAKWNCGWHICSICQKTAHHMCYTCTYSLCRGCIRKADYVCVRDKGFCTICMKTIMLIENNGLGEDGKVQADFDDKLSWEYLFKVYWVYLKGKLSLTLDELTQAKNPWKEASTTIISSSLPSNGVHNMEKPISVGNLEENESKRRKIDEQIDIPPKETVNMEKSENVKSEKIENATSTATAIAKVVKCKEWATKELLEFIAHMKNGNTSVLSRFDVQALMMEYINTNNLRDPKKKNQIVCDSRLTNLFKKPHVGHIQIWKLLEHHFLVKEKSRKTRVVKRTSVQDDADWTCESVLTLGKDKKRRNRSKGEECALQNKLDDFAAVDAYNMNLIYLRRDLMENLLEDSENFHNKVVGSIVRIKILGSDLKHDMYRLVQVVGTSKVDVPYKIDNKSTNVMLEVLNLDKKETISIDNVSDQEFSEEECRRLQQSIQCGLVKHFTVGEIQEKAVALQSLKLNDWMEKETLRLTRLRDLATEKGHKKGYRECVEKLQLLKTPDERERRLQQIPEVHSDRKMNPHYESDDTEEYFNKEHGDHMESKYSVVSTKKRRAARSNDTDTKSQKDEKIPPVIETESTKSTERINMEKDATVSTLGNNNSEHEIDCNNSTITKIDQQPTISSSVSNIPPERTTTTPTTNATSSPPNDVIWHYLDPNGKVQGPFSLLQLQRWNTTGYFPIDMRIWANHEDKTVLLTDVLKDHFDNCENATATVKVIGNQTESVNVLSAIPSSTITATTPDAPNSSGQSFGQNWSASNNINNLNSNPTNVELNTPIEAETDNNHAPVYTPDPVIDLPGPTPKKMVNEVDQIQPVPDSKVVVQDSGNPPSWSSASSLVIGGPTKLPVSEWGVKSEEWVDSFKPIEIAGDLNVATPTSNIDQNVDNNNNINININIDNNNNQSQPMCNDFTTWHGMGEMIEFSTLAEESVSDLLAEVDAMESQYGLPSPTSRRNSFVDDLFNGSFDEFSPTPDQGTRSDGFSSSGDIQLPSQSTDEQHNLVGFDFMKTSLITSAMGPVSQKSDNVGFKWPEMIDINRSAKGEGDEGEMEMKNSDNNSQVQDHVQVKVENGNLNLQNVELTGQMKSNDGLFVEPMKAPKSIGAKLVNRVAQIKGLDGSTNHRRAKDEEDGEFVKPQPLPPPPPPPLTLGLDPFDPNDLESETVQGKFSHTGRPGQSRNDPNPSPNPNPNPNLNQSQRRVNSSNSPRERSNQVEESGYSRSSRRSSLGGNSGGSGGGGSRPPVKGQQQQRVCRFYENGRCKKGASCKYLHSSP